MDTVGDLIAVLRGDKHHLYVAKDSFYLRFINDPPIGDQVFRELSAHLNRTSLKLYHIGSKIDLLHSDSVPLVVFKSRISLINVCVLQLLRKRGEKTRKMHIASESISQDYQTILFRKRSPLVRPFNWM